MKVKNKKNRIEALVEGDQEIQALNFALWTKSPKTTESMQHNFKLPAALKEKIQSCYNDHANQGKGSARLPGTHEKTVGEARDFIRKHWVNKMARDEFPYSSEDDEIANINWIDDMFFCDSRNSSSDIEEIEFNEPDDTHDQVNMVVKTKADEEHEMGKG